ncbi:MAG: hypothetical protein VXZ82_22190 [Planctomycetota bacterium]|nr:hypothetical protein [Planctomycetota bacterium]
MKIPSDKSIVGPSIIFYEFIVRISITSQDGKSVKDSSAQSQHIVVFWDNCLRQLTI